MATHEDRDGWSVSYPADFHVRRVKEAYAQVARLLIASFAAAEWNGGRPPVAAVAPATFPPDGVALAIESNLQSSGAILHEPESAFPLSLGDLEPITPVRREDPETVRGVVYAGGQFLKLTAWAGPAAPAALRARLGEVVASLRFAALTPGTVAGAGFAVLEHRARYPLRVFTPVQARGVDLLLAHAPGGFYALGWSGSQGTSACSHHIDAERLEVHCSDCRGRWDRIGRVLTHPRCGSPEESLRLIPAKVAFDGHVLVHPGAHGIGTDADDRRLWESSAG